MVLEIDDVLLVVFLVIEYRVRVAHALAHFGKRGIKVLEAEYLIGDIAVCLWHFVIPPSGKMKSKRSASAAFPFGTCRLARKARSVLPGR
jgi:hypothetical protein